ncbi:MAG: DNA topoisomerase I [Bacteroidetes bacterium RIFCSPLOWO2_12_FULL_35_15]|nr:MAG: DNA topoisomerase I [Bacteroidetes bacterium RIFCSPLOWO2_12_FULL_35_15]
MSKNLVIVESPAKAKTIEGFLGEGFIVKSSYGHVRDLAKKGFGVDIENNFTPNYEISPDKAKVVAELKKLAKGAETVWLATDEDREGEAISWHLFESLNLNEKNTKRIVFHEITKSAIKNAIANPRTIDKHLVDAQQARRILDRLVGFELSPILWKKIRPSLSAGRVQSVAVRLIVERERDIMSFNSTSAYKVTANFVSGNSLVKAELSTKFKTLVEARTFLKKCEHSDFTIESVETKPTKKTSAAPFTTSTLQQEASRKLGFSVAQTMVVAQRLYESGKITYMRTDSVNLSDTAINQAKEAITGNYGAKYLNIHQYKTKSKGAQEAHEAIRPTYIEHSTITGDSADKRLYELIWKRTIASQMSDAELEKTTAVITISGATEKFVAQGEVLKFDGFLKIYLEGTDEEDEENQEGMLPPMKVGEKLEASEITAIERYTHHPARYTEASLVKKLEELGIGRPSTYAPTISTVQKREYVVKEDREGVQRNYNVATLKGGKITEEIRTEGTGAEKSKLFPTDIGMVVNDFLLKEFPQILDFNFTAKVEEEFDEIAEGKINWTKMLADFYKPFHKSVEHTSEHSERASGERLLGVDPVTGKNVYVRIGRFGPMAQMGESNDENNKPKFASLRKDQRIDTISFQDALDLFKLPRVAGEFEGKEMVVAVGRFGPYVRHDGKFVSLKKEDDPMTVSAERCIELIEAKRQAEIDKYIKTFPENPEVQVLNGRWGPYLVIGQNNFKLPKNIDAKNLTLQECLDIAADPKNASKGNRFKKTTTAKPFKKAAAKKTAAPKKVAVKKTAKKTVKKVSKKK